MTLRFRLVVPVALLAFAVPSAHAQGVQGVQGVQGTRAAAGPTIARAAVGVRAATVAPAKTPPKFADTSHNRKLMVVGGAAMILGTVIAFWGAEEPGALIMLGGAGVGLYGLYKYLE